MWRRNEDDYSIDIQPRGEEGQHIWSTDCECEPRIGRSDDKRTMIVHRTFTGEAGFDLVGEPIPEFYQSRRAA